MGYSMIITKKDGYFIINSAAFALTESTVVSYRDDAIVQEFDSEELMAAAHKEQFPEQYTEDLNFTTSP